MNKFLTLLKVEGKLTLRCPDGIVFGIVMPIGIFILIAVIGGEQIASATKYTFLQSAFASLLTVGICATAFMGIPLTISEYRDKKILKYFFVAPVRAIMLLFGQICISMINAILSAVIITFIAIFCFNYQMQGHILLFISAYFLVMCSMYSLEMIIASLCKTLKKANVVTTFVHFPMLFLSGATIP